MSKKRKQNKTPMDATAPKGGDAEGYHRPVLLHECIEALHIQPDGIYVDVTFGGGGHSREILKHLGPNGRLIGFDQDTDAARNMMDDERVTLVAQNFRYMQRCLRAEGITEVDGILADLGVSSFQFDTADRGFSYRFEGKLDMRMNQNGSQTAADVLNTYDAEKLQQIFGEYGEVRNAKTLALAIVEERKLRRFESINDLKALCEKYGRGDEYRYMAQVFQALRIEVNEELQVLQEFLEQSAKVLKPGGRLAVISFHSLEDRLAKNFMRYGTFGDEPQKDAFGKITKPFDVVTKKPIEAGSDELRINKRAHSAKLRVAERKQS
jgi:16S rRNA (cytosine1402-N4)-methyltransferase